MKKVFKLATFSTNDSEIVVAKEKKAEELIYNSAYKISSIVNELVNKYEIVEITIYKNDNKWFAELNEDCEPIEIIDPISNQNNIPDDVIWYAIGNNKEQLRHLLYILRQKERNSGYYTIARKAAGDYLVA